MKNTRSDTRERRAVEQIACPYCKSPRGVECHMTRRHAGPLCHAERRRANQERARSAAAELTR